MNGSLNQGFRGETTQTAADHLFVGRRKELADLLVWAKNKSSEKLLILEGNAGVGKTSLLGQLASGAIQSGTIVICLDIAQLSTDSATDFIWGIIKEFDARLAEFGLKSPPFEKRLLVLRPWESFRKYYWPDVLRRYGNDLILVLDNFDELVTNQANKENLPFFRSHIKRMFDAHTAVKGMLILRGRSEAYTSELLQPFDSLPSYRISRLDAFEAGELMRRGSALPVFSELSSTIYELTGGHPGDIKLILAALQRRAQALSFSQLTIADLLMVLDNDLAPRDFYTNVYARYAKLEHTYKSE